MLYRLTATHRLYPDKPSVHAHLTIGDVLELLLQAYRQPGWTLVYEPEAEPVFAYFAVRIRTPAGRDVAANVLLDDLLALLLNERLPAETQICALPIE